MRRRRRYEHEGRLPRESLDEAFELLAESGVERRAGARRPRRLARARAHRPPDRGHPAHAAAGALALAGSSRRSTTRALAGRRAALEDEVAAEITLLWQTDEVRARRPRVVDEIRHALWFFETTLLDAAPDVLAEFRERLPAAQAALPLRLVDRRRPGRQPGGRPPDRRRVARARPPARAHALPRRGAPARARDRRLDAHRRRSPTSSTLDRARRGRARGSRARDRRPELRRALPPQAQLRRQAPREPAGGQRRARVRRRRAGCSPTSS